jgi:hypothetical protein
MCIFRPRHRGGETVLLGVRFLQNPEVYSVVSPNSLAGCKCDGCARVRLAYHCNSTIFCVANYSFHEVPRARVGGTRVAELPSKLSLILFFDSLCLLDIATETSLILWPKFM